jgi:nitrite reductase (NO-forming)
MPRTPPGRWQARAIQNKVVRSIASARPATRLRRKNAVGPTLAGIIGKKAASDPNYAYSPALRASGLSWDVATLDQYLLDPQKAVPGNKMPFPGLKTENERRDVIAYLAASAAAAPAVTSQPAPAAPPQRGSVSYIPDIRYTLRSGIAEGRMVFIGIGGMIDGQVNPVLSAAEGQVVQITLINGEGAEHDIVFPDNRRGSPDGVPAQRSPFEPSAPETLPIFAACRAMNLPE